MVGERFPPSELIDMAGDSARRKDGPLDGALLLALDSGGPTMLGTMLPPPELVLLVRIDAGGSGRPRIAESSLDRAAAA